MKSYLLMTKMELPNNEYVHLFNAYAIAILQWSWARIPRTMTRGGCGTKWPAKLNLKHKQVIYKVVACNWVRTQNLEHTAVAYNSLFTRRRNRICVVVANQKRRSPRIPKTPIRSGVVKAAIRWKQLFDWTLRAWLEQRLWKQSFGKEPWKRLFGRYRGLVFTKSRR